MLSLSTSVSYKLKIYLTKEFQKNKYLMFNKCSQKSKIKHEMNVYVKYIIASFCPIDLIISDKVLPKYWQ